MVERHDEVARQQAVVVRDSRVAGAPPARDAAQASGPGTVGTMTAQGRPDTTERLRVVVATPMAEELCRLIEELEPRVQMVHDPGLQPPMRHPADFAGDPDFSRTEEEQGRFEELVDSAEVLYGLPDQDPAELRRTVRANPRLRWVQTMAAGGGATVQQAGLSAEELERVVFTTSAGVHGGPLAEYAVFGVLAGAKDLPRLLGQQRRQEWSGRWTMRQVREMTVLVAGLGGIGAEVARLLDALGATVIGVRRHEDPVEHVHRQVHPDRLADVVGGVDAIVLTLPATDRTTGLIDAAVLDHVKPGTVLVNVGRGAVLDEEALLPALRDGRIGLAVLDVFATEPLPANSPLWWEPNVLVSPHTAALDAAEERRIAELFAANATRFLDGADLLNLVSTTDFY